MVMSTDFSATQLQLKQLEKENRLLKKKLQRSEKNRQNLENYFENQTQAFNQNIQRLEKARFEAEQRQADLQKAFDNLQVMQAKLVESEKMSALGVLMAGIAHEINNPINFIHANISHAQNYVNELLDLVKLYQIVYPQTDPDIRQFIEERDLDFIVEDFDKLLNSMKVGSDRIRTIILGLNSFSRMDQAAYKCVDVHEGLDSTLMILKHRFKPKALSQPIQLVKDYGELPNIMCFAGQLNQVFMNVISNAIEAIEEHALCLAEHHISDFMGQITITTKVIKDKFIQVAIADNAMGMCPEVKQQIFNPFFTTKPVGKGTGLGMSISYKIIVENHKGYITVDSQENNGSKLIIQIPIVFNT